MDSARFPCRSARQAILAKDNKAREKRLDTTGYRRASDLPGSCPNSSYYGTAAYGWRGAPAKEMDICRFLRDYYGVSEAKLPIVGEVPNRSLTVASLFARR